MGSRKPFEACGPAASVSRTFIAINIMAKTTKPKTEEAPVEKKPVKRLKPEDLDQPEEAGNKDASSDEEKEAQTVPAVAEQLPPSGIKGDYLWIYEIAFDEKGQRTGRPHWQQRGKYHAPEGTKAKVMKEKLLSQEKIRVLIPKTPDEKGGDIVPQTVCLNGYRLDIPKGKYVDLPEQVARKINQSYEQTEKALDQFRVNEEDRALN